MLQFITLQLHITALNLNHLNIKSNSLHLDLTLCSLEILNFVPDQSKIHFTNWIILVLNVNKPNGQPFNLHWAAIPNLTWKPIRIIHKIIHFLHHQPNTHIFLWCSLCSSNCHIYKMDFFSTESVFYLKQQSKSKMCSFSSLQNKAEHKLRNVLWRMYTGRLVLAGLTKPKPRVWDNRWWWWWWFSIFSIKPGFLLQDHAHIKRDVSCIIWLFFLPKGSPWVLSNDETGDSSYKEHRKTIKCNSVANNMKLVHKKLVNLGIYFTAVN